jgi:hypothetical protein
VWVPHDRVIAGSNQLMRLVEDVQALLRRLCSEHGTNRIRLFTSLPFHAVPLLTANLTNVVDGEITFMEYRTDLQGKDVSPQERYVALPLPRH